MSEPAAVQDGAIANVEAISEPAAPVPDSATPGGGQDSGNEDSGEEEGANGDGNGQANGTGSSSSSSKKKKKKKSNKKKKAGGAAANGAGGVHAAMAQTEPPSIGLTKIYVNGQFPVGQECEYVGE